MSDIFYDYSLKKSLFLNPAVMNLSNFILHFVIRPCIKYNVTMMKRLMKKCKFPFLAFIVFSLASCNIPASLHEHTFSDDWTYDNTYHWHAATCGHDVVSNKDAHSFVDVVTEPTYSTGGYTTHTCNVCGYSFTDSETDPLPITITWKNYDGKVLETDTNVPYGSTPVYDGDTPTKPSDDSYDYIFSSWDKEIEPATAPTEYVAVFEQVIRKGSITANKESGFYDESFYLELEAPRGFEIYYTLDNSIPDENSAKYSEPLLIEDVSNKPNYYSMKQGISSLDVYYPQELIDKCQIVKAIAINKSSQEKSKVYEYCYFVGYQNKSGYSTLPTVTLDISEDDLYDYEKGIYVTGKIYDESPHEGYPETYPANYHQTGKEWERVANFKYFNELKELELEQTIGVRIHGGWSRAFNQKSFNLYARKEYDGNSTFQKKFFSDINAHSLMLRSGGYRDTDFTKIRDSLNQNLSINESFDIQQSYPVNVFLNGEYWGIYNLQERYSDNYVHEHYPDIKKSNVLIIKNDEIDEGDEKDYHLYEELIDFFKDHSFDDEANYLEAKNYIDVNEFAQYMSTQLYVGNIDWPGNNVRVYRDISTSEAKWHFMMYDTDDSSNILPYKCNANIDPFIKSSHWKSGPLEDTCLLGLMLSKLIDNQEFRTLFRETFIRIGSQNFSPTRVNAYLEEMKTKLAVPMVNNYKRFANSSYDEEYFLSKVDVIKTFFEERYDYAIGFLDQHIPSL